MKNQIILINGYIIVITWGIDSEDSRRAFTRYFKAPDFWNTDSTNGTEITDWKEIPLYTGKSISTAVDNFCEENNLINWSN